MGNFNTRILNLAAIFIILGVSMNLVLGFTGMFSLGHAGFMCVGAYVSAILTMSPESKEMIYFMEPIISPLEKIHWPVLPAILMSGVVAAFFGFLIGFPALRLRDDYLAIATLGFGEIIRIIFTNTITITNGSLGLKNIPSIKSMWIYWGFAFRAIRDNEIAAEAMGILIMGMF